MKAVGILFVAAVLVAGCGGNQPEQATSSARASLSPAPSTAAEPPPAAAVPPAAAACSQAPPKLVALIDQAFTGGENLDNAQSVDGPQASTYIGGNILRGNEVVSSADVWIVRDGAVYALSSDARRRTLLPDGRDFASAGDQFGSAVQDCVA